MDEKELEKELRKEGLSGFMFGKTAHTFFIQTIPTV
jgi:hypothetical protein